MFKKRFSFGFKLFSVLFCGIAFYSTPVSAFQNDLDPVVWNMALTAYNKLYKQGYDPQQILTIVDYSKPSTEKRLWVINLKSMKVLYHTLVAHGSGSGGNQARYFSNMSHTHASSLGVFLTGEPYQGKHGYSLRLNGLEPGINDNALSRDIVVHSANYVSQQFAKVHGRLGRSWGCFALSTQRAPKVIQNIKGGTIIFAYYPNKQWINTLNHTQMFLRV